MAVFGSSSLRDLFDEAYTPLIGHPPWTHHLDYYLATDGSYRTDDGGLGVIVETRDGREVTRLARVDSSPDNNVSEYRALHFGLDVLAARVPPTSTVGILVDHEQLAINVNTLALGDLDENGDSSIGIPDGAKHHWRGIQARLSTIEEVRAVSIDGASNPAHSLANDPRSYKHLASRPDRCVLSRYDRTAASDSIPPPSRARRSSTE